jgi:hypothetical protein
MAEHGDVHLHPAIIFRQVALLSAAGQSINLMTLGPGARIGLLLNNATVTTRTSIATSRFGK